MSRGRTPFELLAFTCRDEPLPHPADIQKHEQVKVVVGIRRERERGEAGLRHVDSKFLSEFPDEGDFRSFAILDLAARKLPEAGHGLAKRTLRQKDPPVDINERNRGHEKDGNVRHGSSAKIGSRRLWKRTPGSDRRSRP